MHNEDLFKNMLDLFGNPLFRAGYAEFAQKAQQEGIEAAKKFWGLSEYGKAFPYSADMCERLDDWYKALGFVTSAKYAELADENARLKAENQALKAMVSDVQLKLFTEGGEKAQQAWHDIIDKQIKLNADVANSFIQAIQQLKPSS
ncbi:MAG: hypothetical protein ACKN9T_04660 [Candidatus Methylumidiphilus sp.]